LNKVVEMANNTGYIVAIVLIAIACIAAVARILWLHFHEDESKDIQDSYEGTAASDTKETTTTEADSRDRTTTDDVQPTPDDFE
jgi:hypothetical protein